MILSNCTFSMIFQPVPGIRRFAFEFEDCLEGYTKPFQVYSIPDNAPYELPRISAETLKGHTTLNIAAQSAQVVSRFDQNYSSNFAKCLDYSKTKAIQALDALVSLMGANVKLTYAGLTTQFLVDADGSEEKPIDLINRTYLKVSSNLALSDALAKLVYEVDEDYFLNLEIGQALFVPSVEVSISPYEVNVTSNQAQSNPRLSLVVDFNNRLAYNKGRILGCNRDTVDVLYKRLLTFAEDGIEVFLSSGEVRFDRVGNVGVRANRPDW
jgi:hypothetical protein